PLTLRYGKKIDSLRRRYKHWIWDAEFRDVLGAKVTSNGFTRYTVFQTSDGKKAVIVANFEKSKTVHAKVVLNDKNVSQFNMVSPEDPNEAVSNGEVNIPARSVVVLMEK
ncbi:MAG TPA: hypothetical protein VHC50_07255, partial [Puia sp.]|nr:hypothetical protein [Puia sp.]